jgi:flagellar protein FlaG
MSQSQVTAIAPGTISGGAPASVSSSERTYNLAVSGAVRTLNESGIVGAGREASFSVDRATHLPVVKVIDTSTQQVIDQWPPEYALRLADTAKGGGQIQDE